MFGRRIARRLGLERNEMWRATDRLEAWLTVSLLLAFVAAALWAGEAAARTVHRADLRQQAWNRAHRFPAEATLLEDPAAPVAADDAGLPLTRPLARASWPVPDGSVRTGVVQVMPEDRTGGRVAIWIDDHGALSAPPGKLSPRCDAAAAAAAVVLGLAAVLILVRRLIRALLNRHRIRSWQREWLEVGPRWSRHR